jgi:transmembrane sensor
VSGQPSDPVVTRDIAAEAAVWIARLHGPDRSPQMERECREWQARSDAHRLAFERMTDVWQDVSRVSLGDAYASAAQVKATEPGGGRVGRWQLPLALACGLVGVAVAVQFWRNLGVYGTELGEQRVVMLEDGSRMSLNTHSRVRVDMDGRQRVVSVEQGEALFEVAKDAKRRFVVVAEGSEVVAHGTVFSVRLIADRAAGPELDVTLLEGKVTVQAASAAGSALAPSTPYAMQPGERLRLVKGADASAGVTQKIDRPRAEGVAAWRRNEVVFDDVALAEAVAEMSRYDRTPVVVVGLGSAADLRVSGVFRTGDTAAFARAVAALHGLVVRERDGRLEIANPP